MLFYILTHFLWAFDLFVAQTMDISKVEVGVMSPSIAKVISVQAFTESVRLYPGCEYPFLVIL